MNLEQYKTRTENSIAESTLNTRLSALRQFREFIDDGEATPQDVENWVEHLIIQHDKDEIKASTIREYYKCVRSYFKTVHGSAREIEHITEWLPRKDVDHGEFLEEDEWEQLRLAATAPRENAFIETMYTYARRPTEVILLNKEDIDFEEETITFNILKKKRKANAVLEVNGKEREVLRATFKLTDNVKQALLKQFKFSAEHKETIIVDGEKKTVTPAFSTGRGRITYSAMYDNIKRIVTDAGIDKNITPKSFRHSRSTHLHWSGKDKAEIAERQLLHSSESDVIEGYVHPRTEDDVREPLTTE